jgi:hypothetical protein
MACAAVSASSPQQHLPCADGACAEILPSIGAPESSPQAKKRKKDTDVQPRSKETISVQVTLLGGEAYVFELPPSATVSDVKVLISEKLGNRTWNQKLVSGTTVLTDSNASLKSFGIADNSVLMLLIDREPIGQSYLEEPNGKKSGINNGNDLGNGLEDTCKPLLNQFELQSWQAACASSVGRDLEWNDNNFGNIGCSGLDLYWTTRSDGCRYEYWSSAPGDNEAGCLVRVDADKMVAIAEGSDDGLCLLNEFVAEFEDNDVFKELVKEGWPRPRAWKRDDSDEEEEDSEEEC